MSTTVEVPEEKYRVLEALAVTEGTTVKELVLEGVDGVINARNPKSVRRLRLPLIDSDSPGSLQLDNEKIYDLIGFP
jgi:hypothetical protein